jgi:mannose-1-phosphate guanylyltransferase/phosphomannomutase
VSVRLAPGDPDSVEIRFFDVEGRDIDAGGQRKIERLLHREDYRRAFAGEIGDITFPPRSIEFYAAALERCVDAARIRDYGFKVVLDYSNGAASIVMPTVLARLGADVLAVNPYASTAAATAIEEAGTRAARIGGLVRASGSHLGLVIDPDGEHQTIVDDEGSVLTSHQAMLALVTLVAEAVPEARFALPVAASREAEVLAHERGASVVWTKMADASLMEVASAEAVTLAAAINGGFIWPDFLPAYDALATLVKLLDVLAVTGRSLSSVVRSLPAVHLAHETVPTPWERKGAVMRELLERADPATLLLVDGVKVQRPGGGWALVLPDPEEPLTHVWAEAGSDPEARQLAQEYSRRIRQALR